MLECVVNVSEGRDAAVLGALVDACRSHLLDVQTDPHHHRSVLTLAGDGVEDAAFALVRGAVALIDLRTHHGVHPRVGAADVVPFVPLGDAVLADARAARDRLAARLASELALPCFLYGPERTLPDVRRGAFRDLQPDLGPAEPHPTAGATCVGARPLLVAYNVWLEEPDVARAKEVAAAIRSPALRALGLDVGGRAQVSCNLLDPVRVGPAHVVDLVAARAGVAGTELVGLVPTAVLEATPRTRWDELDLGPTRTIEARLERRASMGEVPGDSTR